MEFKKLTLPEDISKGEVVSPQIKRTLRIYNQVDLSQNLDPEKRKDQNIILEMFDTRLAYVALDDGFVQGVANYYPEEDSDIGWIEGIATTRGLGVGSFIVRNIVNLAHSQGMSALELRSHPPALGFWVKQGFDIRGEDTGGSWIAMRRELD